MKGTYHGEKKRKEEFSIEEFTLQIKRKAMGFTSAGLAIFIMTFSYYVIGMEDNLFSQTNPNHQALPKEKSDTSEDTNTSDQFAISDKSSQPDTTDSEEAAEISENRNSQTDSPPSSKTSSSHHSSDMVAIIEPSEELPIYEKGEIPPVNENQVPPKSCFKWKHPGFLEKLDHCKRKDTIQPGEKAEKIFHKIIPQNKIKIELRLPKNRHKKIQQEKIRNEEKRYVEKRHEEDRHKKNDMIKTDTKSRNS